MKDNIHYTANEYIKHKISIAENFTKQFVSDAKLNFIDDIITDHLLTRLDVFVLAQLKEKQTIYIYTDRPKFLDWLLRRRKTHKVEINIRDVLQNPPAQNEDTIRLYELKTLNDEC